MPDFAVVALLGDLVAEVHGSAWPLHLTLALFGADEDAATVVEAVTQVVTSVAPFDIEPGPRADFGPNRDVPAFTGFCAHRARWHCGHVDRVDP